MVSPELRDAKLSYDRAIELDPDLVEARVDRALVELELDQTEHALADLRAAASLASSPRSVRPWPGWAAGTRPKRCSATS
jgi:tetratricopeptide (TPR) repeat protein